MPVERQTTPSASSQESTTGDLAARPVQQTWVAAARQVSAAEQLRDFTREILSEEEPERWDGMS